MEMDVADTIVAISTPPGRGGIGVVRLAGPEAVAVAEGLVRLLFPGKLGDVKQHGRARLALVLDPDFQNTGVSPLPLVGRDDGVCEKTIDEALVTVFHAPHSYTGDMLVEIAAHGSPVVLEALVRGALKAGISHPNEQRPLAGDPDPDRGQGSGDTEILRCAQDGSIPKKEGCVRLAGPGEFTQRAFLAGKLDLTQAEAVHDLIAAQTLDQARVAAQQLGGALSRRIAPAKEELLYLIAMLEAGMDFASGELDDVDVVAPEAIAAAIERAGEPLRALAGSFRRGQLMREGAAIALIGRPNAGKSSLFNGLLERERAIVTPVAGTTRDTVEEQMSLGGVPLRLIDTAGIRGEGALEVDEAERQGMVRSQEALADADLVLLVLDGTLEMSEEELRMAAGLVGRPHVVVRNKVDLVERREECEVWTSAVTGEGLESLRLLITKELGVDGGIAATGALNTLRQQEAVGAAMEALGTAAVANASGMPHEVLLMDLHAALRAMDSLTGVTTADDILARIFAAFCIGK